MTDPRPGGSHRRVDRGRRLRVLLVSLVVVVVAAGGVEAALHWRGESKRPTTTAASSGYPRISPSATPSGSTPPGSAPASSSLSGSALPGSSLAGAASSPADAPSSTPPVTYPVSSGPAAPPAATASSASPAPSTPIGTPLSRPPIDVLNSTHVSGMAARAATVLTGGGWTVAETGNYTHSLAATTLFYPAGQLTAAQALAAEFTAIGKVSPAPDGVSTTDLTLVLGPDWTSSGK